MITYGISSLLCSWAVLRSYTLLVLTAGCIVCNFRTLLVIADCHRPLLGCTTAGSNLRQQQRHRLIPQQDCLQTWPTVIETFNQQLTWLIKLFIRDTNKCPFDSQIQYRFYMFPHFMPPEISISVPTGVDYRTIFKLPDNILYRSTFSAWDFRPAVNSERPHQGPQWRQLLVPSSSTDWWSLADRTVLGSFETK
jgi:hypothetical protein